jgi:hypothetical protein
VYAVELRVVVAAVLAVAADALFVAQHHLKLGAHLVTTLARLHVHNLARRSSLEAGSKLEKKKAERSEETLENPCGSSAHEAGNTDDARACIPNGKLSGFTTPISRALGTVKSTLGVGRCGCSLQFTKASAATLL